MTHRLEESDVSNSLETTLARSALLFEADVLDQLVSKDPGNLAYLAALGQACSKLKNHVRGLDVDRRLVKARPEDPTFRYNLACSLALTGDLDGACKELLASIDLGFQDFEHLSRDEDLASLRADKRFALIEDRIAE